MRGRRRVPGRDVAACDALQGRCGAVARLGIADPQARRGVGVRRSPRPAVLLSVGRSSVTFLKKLEFLR
jgi:hypothetical protein